jgi:DegV family protein with EDD domain
VVDGRSASVGLSLVVREARRAAEAGSSVPEIVEIAERAAGRVRLYCTVATLRFLARGGRMPVMNARILEFLKLRPILSIHGDVGKAARAGIGFGFMRAREKMLRFLERDGAALPGAEISIAHCDALRAAERVAEEISRRFGIPVESIPITACSPVLAAHAGPGAVAVALLPPDPERRG